VFVAGTTSVSDLSTGGKKREKDVKRDLYSNKSVNGDRYIYRCGGYIVEVLSYRDQHVKRVVYNNEKRSKKPIYTFVAYTMSASDLSAVFWMYAKTFLKVSFFFKHSFLLTHFSYFSASPPGEYWALLYVSFRYI